MKGDAGALDEPLDIYFTFSLCGKSERETEGEEISPRSYFPHSGELQAAQLHYTCTEQSARRRFTKTTKYLVTDCLTCSVEDGEETGRKVAHRQLSRVHQAQTLDSQTGNDITGTLKPGSISEEL